MDHGTQQSQIQAAMQEQLQLLTDQNEHLNRAVNELSTEKATLLEENSKLENEVQDFKKMEIESQEKEGLFLKSLDSLRQVKDCMTKIITTVDVKNENADVSAEETVEMKLDEKLMELTRMATLAEEKVREYEEKQMKEKRELESSVVSLTEENRDINSLLRIALVEKETVEKSLNKVKGNEQRRPALLQFAEKGLQRVGFGFMMGSGSGDQITENSSSTSDYSDCEEEVVSVVSTVDKIVKNLRSEITQLRRSLEESRSDNERLQRLTENQAQKIEENTMYIRHLEVRERVLSHKVEELLLQIKETEEEVARWREACELEVQAGNKEIKERDKVIAILKQELEKTKAALDISNGKLKLKEELAATAMAAQEAAERSLQLADTRHTEFRKRIEELTKQLEEAEKMERSGWHSIRHICLPWRALTKLTRNSNGRLQNGRQRIPEMQALLS